MSTHEAVPVNHYILQVIGSPESRDYAAPATIAADLSSGNLYVKTTNLTLNTGWNQIVTAGVNGIGQQFFQTFAALMAKLTHLTGEMALVRGNLTPTDGNGGIYIYDSTDTRTADGLSIGQPTNVAAGSAGRWNKWI